MSQAPDRNRGIGEQILPSSPFSNPTVNSSQSCGLAPKGIYPGWKINQNLGRELIARQSYPSMEVNIQNGAKLNIERWGDSIIVHIARNKDQSAVDWLAESIGAAAYGVYSYPQDVAIGVYWALAYLAPKDWEVKKEADEVAEIVGDSFRERFAVAPHLIRSEDDFRVALKVLNIKLIFLLIRLQIGSRNKSLIQMAARLKYGNKATTILLALLTRTKPTMIHKSAAFIAAVAGSLFRSGNDVKIARQKGIDIKDVVDVLLTSLLTGDTDLRSHVQVIGEEIYDQIYELIEKENIRLKFDDEELQIINLVRESIIIIINQGMEAYFNYILESSGYDSELIRRDVESGDYSRAIERASRMMRSSSPLSF